VRTLNRDADSTHVEVPQRIVSLVPSHTESLHALGLQDRVVGRTRFCIHPKDWIETIPHVGGTKDADLMKILALKPDLVVADKDENPLALIEALDERGIEVFYSEIDTVPDAAQFLELLAYRCGVSHAGRDLAADIWDAICDVEPNEEPIPVFCPIWHEPWMTFDGTAYPNAMLEAVGLRNVFHNHDGPKYFEVSDKEIADAGAKFTLLPTEPFPFHKRRESVDTLAFGAAGQKGKVLEIDGEALTWFGVRTAEGLQKLAAVRKSLLYNGT
jgi:ABC-type hemin transport system substrate-binding protein